MKLTFLYYASDSFVSRAKVLTDSIQKFHPDSNISYVNPGPKPIGKYIHGMAKERLRKALELLEKGHECVVVIGADCELFGPLNEITKGTDSYKDVLLVPHVKRPIKNRGFMAQLYRSGHANADLMVFKNSNNSKEILKWMISVTESECNTEGIFYEQTWLSALPFLFGGVGIIHNEGYNVGYWDLEENKISNKDGLWFIGDHPIVFFQYSGYLKGSPEKASRYFKYNVTGDTLEFFKNYEKRITE